MMTRRKAKTLVSEGLVNLVKVSAELGALTLLSHRFTGNSTSCYGLNMQDVTSIPIHSFPVELCLSNLIMTITVNGMLHCCSNQLLSFNIGLVAVVPPSVCSFLQPYFLSLLRTEDASIK